MVQGVENSWGRISSGTLTSSRARFRISIKDHHTCDGLKVELVDAPGLWGERRYTIRLNLEMAVRTGHGVAKEIGRNY